MIGVFTQNQTNVWPVCMGKKGIGGFYRDVLVAVTLQKPRWEWQRQRAAKHQMRPTVLDQAFGDGIGVAGIRRYMHQPFICQHFARICAERRPETIFGKVGRRSDRHQTRHLFRMQPRQ